MAANTPPDAGGAGEARREVRLEECRTLEKWAFIGVWYAEQNSAELAE